MLRSGEELFVPLRGLVEPELLEPGWTRGRAWAVVVVCCCGDFSSCCCCVRALLGGVDELTEGSELDCDAAAWSCISLCVGEGLRLFMSDPGALELPAGTRERSCGHACVHDLAGQPWRGCVLHPDEQLYKADGVSVSAHPVPKTLDA